MHEMDNPFDEGDPPSKKSIKKLAKEKYDQAKQKLSDMREYLSDFYGGINDFIDTYNEMKTANWKNSDKYFHSKANYKATLRGPGGEAAAIKMSNLREITDQYIKGDSRASSIADQKANLYGRQQAHRRANFIRNQQNMRFIINKYRPISLPNKY
ncbi:serum amyloid a protein [Riemerella anatipestifer]